MDIKIIFEDTDFLVLDKPSGLTVNKADTTKGQETVQEWVEKNSQLSNSFHSSSNEQSLAPDRIPDTYSAEEEFKSRGGVVHRLDKETSGILLVAKNPESFLKLKEQFMNRTVK